MNETNRQILPPGLWVVATPIGNLGDFTPRARWALEHATWVLCEDTRRTAHLFSALGFSVGKGRLSRFDAHADPKTVEKWIEVLQRGDSIALVTDAGTPSVSDPGSVLVAAAHEGGVRVTPVPGVSAVSTLLSVAGFIGASFNFGGFFPRKQSEQVRVLQAASVSSLSQVYVWFESPHRVQEALSVIEGFVLEHCPDASVVAGKELTKLHEKIFRGSATSVKNHVDQEMTSEGILGEWCIGIEFPRRREEAISGVDGDEANKAPWFLALSCLIEEGVSLSRAVKRVSQAFGVSKNRVYEQSLKIGK